MLGSDGAAGGCVEACERTRVGGHAESSAQAQQAPVCLGGPQKRFEGWMRGVGGYKAVMNLKNVSHKHNGSGKFLQNIYQSPVSAIISTFSTTCGQRKLLVL